MTRLAVFTTGSCNRLGMARALMATVRQHYPEADLFICVGDDATGLIPPSGCHLVAGADIGVPGWRRTCFAYDIMGLNCLLKPFMFLHLIETLGYDRVIHCDTDMALFDRLHAVDAALDAGASLVITPHLLAPPAPADVPGPRGILMAGTYNTGFVAASSNEAARAALRWWAARVHEDGGAAPERGLVWDQRWMDLVPGLFPAVHITRDPALNVAYWNLPQRRLSRDGGGWTVAGHRLGLFHFSGFDPADPTRLTRHATSIPTPPPRGLAALLAEYAALLSVHHDAADATWPYAHARFASGTLIPPAARTLFHAHHRDWRTDPFVTFEAHLNAPSPGAARHPAGLVLTNLLAWLVQNDPHAQHLFDTSTAGGVAGAVSWATTLDLPAPLLAAAMNGADAEALPAIDTQSAGAAARELAAIHRSTSWRLTAPLRALATLLGRRR